MTEAAKALLLYFEVLRDGFVKRPCDADLVFCSQVSDVRMKPLEETSPAKKMFIDKQTNICTINILKMGMKNSIVT